MNVNNRFQFYNSKVLAYHFECIAINIIINIVTYISTYVIDFTGLLHPHYSYNFRHNFLIFYQWSKVAGYTDYFINCLDAFI